MTKKETVDRTHTDAAWEQFKAFQERAYTQGGLHGVLFFGASAFKESEALSAACAKDKLDARKVETLVAEHLTTAWLPRVGKALDMAPNEQR